MKKLAVMIILLTLTPSLFAQDRRAPVRRRYSEGFYIMIGATKGPSFSEFFNYLNNTFNPPEKIKEFGTNVSFSLGYISRFHRNFAVDVGFSVYSLNSVGQFPNPNSTIPESVIRHELDYEAAIFSGTAPIIFEFSPSQPVVPYVGIGISIFSIRLDHYRDVYFGSDLRSYASRDSRTSVGGHFEAGTAVKITRRLWADVRGRWHTGNGKIATLEQDFRDFDIKQNVSQYSAGVNYFFH